MTPEIQKLKDNHEEAFIAFIKARNAHIEAIKESWHCYIGAMKKDWYCDWDSELSVVSYAREQMDGDKR
tara:strand:+ start:305 stop:511 length:207 start_codon:yes stop_codon:yes gene_type:complete